VKRLGFVDGSLCDEEIKRTVSAAERGERESERERERERERNRELL
jgi:hypothetical protein